MLSFYLLVDFIFCVFNLSCLLFRFGIIYMGVQHPDLEGWLLCLWLNFRLWTFWEGIGDP